MRCEVFHEILQFQLRTFALLGPQKVFLLNSENFSRLRPLNGPVLRPRKGCNEPLRKTFTNGFNYVHENSESNMKFGKGFQGRQIRGKKAGAPK